MLPVPELHDVLVRVVLAPHQRRLELNELVRIQTRSEKN